MDEQRKLKAALYIRVSTEEQAQDGQSASAQAETLKQYCNAFDIEAAGIYEDLGLSGKSLRERSGLIRLLDDSAKGCFDMVLVWKISRLSRNLKDLLYLIDTFERNNVHFASCSEKFDTSTPVGRMTLQLLGSIAEFERNTIIENVKLGLREYARKGGKAASLLGYDNVDRKLVINEQEAAIIKMIFSLYTVSGMSYSAIAKHLNSLGCRTKRGSEFRSSSISYIIHNPAYIGTNRHRADTGNEYCIIGAHPAIIDEATWDMAQNTGPQKKRCKAENLENDSLHLPVTCMQCNAPMKVFYAFSKGKRYKYMRCSNCSNYVNHEKLQKAVIQALTSIIANESYNDALQEIISSTFAEEYSNVERSTIESEIKRLERSKSRYLQLFESYKLSDTKAFVERITEIDNRIKELKIKKFDCVRKGASTCNDLVERLAAAETAAIQQLSDCLIRAVRVNKGEIEIVLYI